MSGTGLLLLNYQGVMTRSNGVQVIIDKLHTGRFEQHYLDHFLWVQHPWGGAQIYLYPQNPHTLNMLNCNISVFKLFTPIRPKIKHQATCLDLSQKSSSSNTPTSDYYMKHYHQPKCNQPGHKFVDEDQEKTSEQSTKLKIFGP